MDCLQESHKIPRIIHRTFSNPNSLPRELIENGRSIQQMNTDWELRFYDDSDRDDFIQTNYSREIIEAYRSIDRRYGAARADLFRYLVCYKLGGIYLDIKSTTKAPLSLGIRSTDSYLLSHWDNSEHGKYAGWGLFPELKGISDCGEYPIWCIASVPGHPFLESVINLVVYRLKKYSVLSLRSPASQVLYTTGPIAYTTAIAPLRHKFDHRVVSFESDLGLRHTIYDDPFDHYSKYPNFKNMRYPLVRQGRPGQALYWCATTASYLARKILRRNDYWGKL